MKMKVWAVQEKNINFANMIELSKHIEVLLLENDCVIVPGLGGFIAHYRSSVYKEKTQEYYPPMRTVGFNPRLVMNDGLLVQSYMQAYNTDFPDATRRIEKAVSLLKEELYKKGQFSLGGVGVLFYNMDGDYGFESCTEGYFTPSLYGLQRFSLPLLSEDCLDVSETIESVSDETETVRSKSVLTPIHHWLQTAVAVAAAVLLFFVWSVPVENTYMDEANYASLGTATLFDVIRGQSVATRIPGSSVRQDINQSASQKRHIRTVKPVVVKTEKVAKAEPYPAEAKKKEPVRSSSVSPAEVAPKKEIKPAAQAVKKSQKTFYIIVASLTTRIDAQKELEKFRAAGCTHATVLESAGKFRIAFDRYPLQTDAYQKVKELRKQEAFKNAWVFTSNQ